MNANSKAGKRAGAGDIRPTANRSLVLSPMQQKAYDELEEVLTASPVIVLTGVNGIGKTAVVNALAAEHRGCIIGTGEIFGALESRHGAHWDEAVEELVMSALRGADLVIIDDYSALSLMSRAMSRMNFFPSLVAKRLCDAAAQMGKRLVLVGSSLPLWGSVSETFSDQALLVSMSLFEAEDYAHIAASVLGEAAASGIDFKVVHRYTSVLQGYQLRLACELLRREGDEPTTENFIACLRNHVISSNARMEEVEALGFDSLPGAEHIGEALEAEVVLPFQNRELAAELGLKPKRGVLLYGPPGTGKTSIGRALAHRIKGKFFLIDGTFVTEPPTTFFQKIQKVVQEAKNNSPSVLFIDDADVLFRIDHVAGLSRYLLSLLDGLESASAGNVCVMMTAMDVRKIPEALLRSGRVELWLETHVPDEPTRALILQRWMGTEMPGSDAVDYPRLAGMTQGCTPADLRRLVRDARTLYAADLVAERTVANATEYVAQAVKEIVISRGRMASLLGDERLRIGPAEAAA